MLIYHNTCHPYVFLKLALYLRQSSHPEHMNKVSRIHLHMPLWAVTHDASM